MDMTTTAILVVLSVLVVLYVMRRRARLSREAGQD
jgi:hypothetical protein